jgi:hypothetical protein
VRGVLIPSGEQLPMVLTVACSPEVMKGPPPRFEVTQYADLRLIGGSAYIFNLVNGKAQQR